MQPLAARSVILIAALGATSCISRSVDVVPLLSPTRAATLDELEQRIDRMGDVHSLILRVDLQIETSQDVEEGRAKQYRTAQGRLLLERPDLIRLNIEAPILSASIAEMASDGKRFQLLIHPPEYRALIEGSNDASYEKEAEKLDDDPELKKAGPLVNIRPQHFTGAFLLSPVSGDSSRKAFFHEERILEPDTRPGAKKESQVLKSYYVVTVVHLGDQAPRRRYWFDASDPALQLTRQEMYDPAGRLVGDVRYSAYLPPDPNTGLRFASNVRIERPYDRYAVELNVKADGITVNRELPQTAFEIQAPEEWSETLRRIDLDQRRDTTDKPHYQH